MEHHYLSRSDEGNVSWEQGGVRSAEFMGRMRTDMARHQFHIRPVEAGDLPAVVALDIVVTGIEKADYWREMFERYGASRGGQRFFLITDDSPARGKAGILGLVIGEIRAWEFGSPPCGWVFDIAVAPDLRLEGLGTALLDAIADRFRKAGVTKMRTMVSRDNHVLLSFLRSQGMMAGPYIQLEKDLDEDS